MTQALRLGGAASLNLNTGSYGSPTWSAIQIVTDVTQNLDADEADASTRGNFAFKATEPTLLGIALEFDILEDIADTNYASIRAAYFARTTLDVFACTGPAATSGEIFVRAVYKMFGFKKGEPLNGINKYTVTIKPCYSANPPTTGTVS
jgi:hypothetical protein